MRGKDAARKQAVQACGITPAYAGKSIRNQHSPDVPEDHPRLCGEKLRCGFRQLHATGSPPPMRGKVFPQNRINIIVEDHPRLCGEKFVQHLQCYLYTGSPPPMRGKVPSSYVLGKYGRITPAYAGKSKRFCVMLRTVQDHPRLCGEKWGQPM